MIKHGFSSSFFDLTRFIAALFVVFGHGMSRFFEAFSWESDPHLFELVFRTALAGYGSQAVTIFFILSGFFIGMSVIKQTDNNRFSYKPYLLKRIIRLWIVLIPGLLLTLLLDTIGVTFFSQDLMYSGGNIVGAIEAKDLTLNNFLINIIFLQNTVLALEPFGTNGALWSLANEFWYYAIFPLVIYLFLGIRPLFSTMMLLLVLVTVGVSIAKLFPLWLMGVGVFVLSRREFLFKWFSSKAALYLILTLSLLIMITFRVSTGIDKDIESYTVGILFSCLMLSTLANDHVLKSKRAALTCSTLASFSYSLYVIHTPLLGFFRALIIKNNDYLLFNITNSCLFLLVIIAIIGLSYIFARLTEHHTGKLYSKLRL